MKRRAFPKRPASLSSLGSISSAQDLKERSIREVQSSVSSLTASLSHITSLVPTKYQQSFSTFMKELTIYLTERALDAPKEIKEFLEDLSNSQNLTEFDNEVAAYLGVRRTEDTEDIVENGYIYKRGGAHTAAGQLEESWRKISNGLGFI